MKNQLLILAAVLLLSGLTGCTMPSLSEIDETLAYPNYSLPAAPPRPAEVAPPVAAPQPAPLDVGSQKRYPLAMVDLELGEALASLSRLSPVPIIAEKDVTGTVNLTVENRPLAEILQAMIKPLGYAAYIEDGVIVVGRPRLETRAFRINYLRDKRSSSSTTNASISSGSTSSDGYSSSSTTSTAQGGRQGNVNVTTSGSSDFWAGLIQGLETIVFGEDGGKAAGTGKKIVVNDLAGIIYVTDTEENMAVVSAFLADIEQEVKRQVLIQAHIVEVELNKKFELGIDWQYIIDSASTTLSQGLAPIPKSGAFNIEINSSDFNLLLDAFQEQGHVNMLSSPKISTMNNQKAVIKLTTKEVTWVNTTTINATGEVLTTSTEPQIDEVGLFLDVTPNIAGDGIITMHIHPSISEIKGISTSPDKTGTKPIINVREVDTMVDIKSGQTVVIGGLIAERTNEVKRSVPLLGDIPYMGLLFSNFRQERKRTELVIFLTPYVLDESSSEQIRYEHEARLHEMNKLTRFIESMERTTGQP
jgi:MSHA biogenesis protein MshL